MATGRDDEAVRGWAPYGLAARIAAADARAQAELDTAIADLAIADATRLDDRTRLDVAELLDRLIATIGAALWRHAARLLADRDIDGAALLRPVASVMPRLALAGALRDRDLIADLIARVRHDRIAAALPTSVATNDDPGLLIRLAGTADTGIAEAAVALLAADGHRRDARDRGEANTAALPADLHSRITWQVAAALRGQDASVAVNRAVDRALVAAATRLIAAHDDAERPDDAALRLVVAIDPGEGDLAILLLAAIGDRRLGLFIALVAHRLGITVADMRAIVIDPAGDRLWLALRALGLERAAIARIGLALADADPRRDIDAFARQLDAIAAIPAADAVAALAPLTLPSAFHAAIRMLDRWHHP